MKTRDEIIKFLEEKGYKHEPWGRRLGETDIMFKIRQNKTVGVWFNEKCEYVGCCYKGEDGVLSRLDIPFIEAFAFLELSI